MQLAICPLQFHVEKAPSKLQQERIISTVETYKHVVRFCELYRYFFIFMCFPTDTSRISAGSCYKFLHSHAKLLQLYETL